MANTIEYAKIFQTELDKAFAPAAVTGWMDANSAGMNYAGGAEIKIPSILLSGLGTYDRAGGTGAPEGDITFSYQTVTMTQDRARGFTLDEMDVSESNFALSMGRAMGEFQRLHVVPEVDAYRLSKLCALAGDSRRRSLTVTISNVLNELTNDLIAVQDKVGFTTPLMCHISSTVLGLLINNDKVQRKLDISQVKSGDWDQRVRTLDGVPLIPTASGLMKTAFHFKDGHSAGEEAGGFAAASDAKAINWLICAKGAPLSPCKQDAVRTFSPETWQKARAWHSDYRRYYDLFIPNNQLDGVFVNIAV